MEADGWELASGPGGPRIAGEREPEYLMALLQPGEQQVALDVRRSSQGGIAVGFPTGYAGPRVDADQLKQRITDRCMS